jgi:hypothetical protein
MYWRGSMGPIHSSDSGGRTKTSKRSCAPYQISSSFSDTSASPLPTTIHSMSLTRPLAGIWPLVWMRPITQPLSPSNCATSCPALPAATQMQRPGTDIAESIQREMALDPSCAWPLVPRLTLIASGRGRRLLGESSRARLTR